MPFKSKAQRAFAYSHPEKFGGKKGLAEWERHTPKKLPKYAEKKKNKAKK